MTERREKIRALRSHDPNLPEEEREKEAGMTGMTIGEARMTIGEAQRLVDRWIREIGGGYFSELTNMVVLTEEVGELARVIARLYGDQKAKPGDLRKNLSEELADVLWVVLCLANQTGVDLTDALLASHRKKTERDRNRFKN